MCKKLSHPLDDQKQEKEKKTIPVIVVIPTHLTEVIT